MIVRPALESDRSAVLDVHRQAFDTEAEAELTALLLDDPTAAPVVSLLAEDAGGVVGHVLLTAAAVDGAPCGLRAAILAPLAVVPARQGEGIGAALVEAALDAAREAGTALVFVLGHPAYYPRFGFRPASPHGLVAPHPIPAEHDDAWMVAQLADGALEGVRGTVRVSEVLGRQEYWVE